MPTRAPTAHRGAQITTQPHAGESPGELGTPDQPGLAPEPLSAEQLAALHAVGERWRAALGGPRRREALPVDPDLPAGDLAPSPASRFERLAYAPPFAPARRGELSAGALGEEDRSRAGRLGAGAKRVLIGPPLATTSLVQERLSKIVALPVLSSDALSSVAYGTEAMLGVLILAGSTSYDAMLGIGAVIALLMVIVALSYRQTIRAYPTGGGSYIVATDNLGRIAGLAAAAGLITDYVLTVAVSTSSGMAALGSAWQPLNDYLVELSVVGVLVVLALNLRGVRQAGAAFAIPTYAFVVAMLSLIVIGMVEQTSDGFAVTEPPNVPAAQALGVFLILRAFASGCSAMTGIEAISDGVPVFREPRWRNARTVLTWMVTLLVVMFGGITYLVYANGFVPESDQTLLSQLASETFGHSVLYYATQIATLLILVLAANTAFGDFPRLLFFLARDRRAPRAFRRVGDRLAFSNGIVLLGAASIGLIVLFDADTDKLINLYAIGVFLAFTLSQAGMVVHHRRLREPGWQRGLAMNGLGAAVTAAVVVVIAVSKFTHGAWIVFVIVPLVVVTAIRIERHYRSAADQLAVGLPDAPPAGAAVVHPWDPETPTGVRPERAVSPDEMRELVVVPVNELDRAALRALAWAADTGHPVLALHVAASQEAADRIRAHWEAWGDLIPLETVVAPHRTVVPTMVNYIGALAARRPDLTLTVAIPEVVPARARHRVLHNHLAGRLRAALRRTEGVVVAMIPFHLAPD